MCFAVSTLLFDESFSTNLETTGDPSPLLLVFFGFWLGEVSKLGDLEFGFLRCEFSKFLQPTVNRSSCDSVLLPMLFSRSVLWKLLDVSDPGSVSRLLILRDPFSSGGVGLVLSMEIVPPFSRTLVVMGVLLPFLCKLV